MEWFKDLYDEFRMQRNFGNIPDAETKKDVDFICDVLNLAKGAKVLDLFCGVGRHCVELARRGYMPVGIDFNKEYLEMVMQSAREKQVNPVFIQGDVRQVDFGKGYDGAIIMFQSFGYFSDEEDRLILKKVYDALRAKRRFLMELVSRDWLLRNFEEKAEYVVNGVKVVEEREFDMLTSRNNFTITRYQKEGVLTKKGSWRFYSAHEIKKVLENMGFEFVAGYDNLSKEPVRKDTRLMRLVFEK